MKKRKRTSQYKKAAAVFITAALCIAFALGLAGCGTDSGSATSDGTYDTVSEAFFLMNELPSPFPTSMGFVFSSI